MKMQWKVAAAAVAVSGLVLAGCSSGGSDSQSGSAASGDKTVITIWTLSGASQNDVWNELVEGFEAKYPDYKVVTEFRATDPHKDALRQAIGTDAMPDLYRYWGGPGLGGELVNVGASVDITDMYDEYGWEEILTGPALANATQYGDHHGVPFIQASEAVFYNKALFEEAGITETPTTYDELVEDAKKLKAAGITPMAFGGTVNWHVMRLLDSIIESECGAEKADELTKGDGDWANEPCVTKSFEELKTWGDDYFPEGYMGISNDDSSQLFYSGQAAMTIEGDWFGSMTLDNGMDPEEVGIFAFPSGTDRLYGFGELFYVTEKGEKNPGVPLFIDFLISEEGQAILGTTFSTLSVNSNVTPEEGTHLGEGWTEIVTSADGGYMNNDQNFSTAETTEFWRIQNSVLTGGLSPEEAGAEFQAWRDANN